MSRNKGLHDFHERLSHELLGLSYEQQRGIRGLVSAEILGDGRKSSSRIAKRANLAGDRHSSRTGRLSAGRRRFGQKRRRGITLRHEAVEEEPHFVNECR